MMDYFFILGAPKCGTTSLAYWLSQHPEVSFSEPKEPRFFNTDFSLPFRPDGIDSYEALFAPKPGAIVKGEATVNYLCSDVALENILEFFPNSKFIVCVRPHVDLFLSLHKQRLKEGIESAKSPEKAWCLQRERMNGHHIPKGCFEPKLLQYERFCLSGKQISRLLEKVGSDKVRVYQLSEISQFPEQVFQDACGFLGIDKTKSVSYEVKNTGTIPRLLVLARIIRALGMFRQRVGVSPIGVGTFISRWNLTHNKGHSVRSEFLESLEEHFEKDNSILAELLQNRDYL